MCHRSLPGELQIDDLVPVMRINKLSEALLLSTIFTPNQHFTKVNDALSTLDFLEVLLGVRHVIYNDKVSQ